MHAIIMVVKQTAWNHCSHVFQYEVSVSSIG